MKALEGSFIKGTVKTSRSFVDSSTIGRVLLGTNDKRGTHERHNLGIAAARLHPSWAGDPLFPTLPLLTSSDVAILTLANPVIYSKGLATYHVTSFLPAVLMYNVLYVQSPTPLKDNILGHYY